MGKSAFRDFFTISIYFNIMEAYGLGQVEGITCQCVYMECMVRGAECFLPVTIWTKLSNLYSKKTCRLTIIAECCQRVTK